MIGQICRGVIGCENFNTYRLAVVGFKLSVFAYLADKSFMKLQIVFVRLR